MASSTDGAQESPRIDAQGPYGDSSTAGEAPEWCSTHHRVAASCRSLKANGFAVHYCIVEYLNYMPVLDWEWDSE